MAKIVSVQQMRTIEEAVDESGHTYDDMMALAGQAVADEIAKRMVPLEGRRVVILAGSGNNGGDGLVAGHHLAEAGAQVSVYLSKSRPEDDPNLSRLKERGILVAEADQDQRWRVLGNMLSTADVVVDAVLGTGLSLPLRGAAKELLERAKKALESRERQPFVVAVDCPSGLDCDSGEVAPEALRADLTVTLAAAKPGLLKFPGAEQVGEIVVGDIGVPDRQPELDEADLELATPEMVRAWLPERPRNSHKGTYGRAVVVGGSVTLPGAAALAGEGAYRVGAGLVTLAVPSSVQGLLAPQLAEATWILLPHEIGLLNEDAVEVLMEGLEGVDAVLIGPGLGQDKPTRRFMGRLLGLEVTANRGKLGFVAKEEEASPSEVGLPPAVLDADALKLLKDIPEWNERLPAGSILTPHPGEMAILSGEDKDEIQNRRVDVAREFAKSWGHVLVLKGAFTVVAGPEGRTVVLPFATSALATAGTGDVLAGAILGLRAQGVAPFEAAVLGCYLHGRAGEIAAFGLGSEAAVVAGDVADALAEAIHDLGGNAGSGRAEPLK